MTRPSRGTGKPSSFAQGETSKKVRVARIGSAHGVRGEVNLWSFTEDPAAIAAYGPLEKEDGSRSFKIESLRAAKDHFIVRFAGITDRSGAEAIRNLELFVPRDRLRKIDEPDTFYHADLVGLNAVTVDGTAVGIVSAVHNFGAGDIIEITPEGDGKTMMLPFTETVVPQINLTARKIVVVPPNSE